MSDSKDGVARILYKQITEGDLRKIVAASNDSKTGGGARDFRFGSYDEIADVIPLFFPERDREKRRRGREEVFLEVYRGTFYWQDLHGVHSKTATFEPPTSARPKEGRICRVHEQPCFSPALVPRFGHGNRLLLLLIQLKSGQVWPYYVEEKSLRESGDWHPSVAREILECLDRERSERTGAIGFRDFVNQKGYCNGR